MPAESGNGNGIRGYRFDAHVNGCRNGLYHQALLMTGNPDNAQDLLQETLEKAWKGFDGYGEGTNFRAWLYRIMVNTCINGYRRGQRAPQVLSWDDLPANSNYLPTDRNRSARPDHALMDSLPQEDLKVALDQLPDDFRAAVVLRDVHELSYRQIGDILRAPLGTVRSRIFRGRRNLREALAGNPEFRQYLGLPDDNKRNKRARTKTAEAAVA